MREQNIFWLKNFTKADIPELVGMLEEHVTEAAIIETNLRYIGRGGLWSLQQIYKENEEWTGKNRVTGDYVWRLTLKQQSDKIKTVILLRWD